MDMAMVTGPLGTLCAAGISDEEHTTAKALQEDVSLVQPQRNALKSWCP